MNPEERENWDALWRIVLIGVWLVILKTLFATGVDIWRLVK